VLAMICASGALGTNTDAPKITVFEGGSEPSGTIEPDLIPYFSPGGQELAKKLGVPAPPLKVMTHSEADPPRDVVAAEWKSAFCLDWDDGCTRCMRPNLDGETSCGEYGPDRLTKNCVRRNVVCHIGWSAGAEKVCSERSAVSEILNVDGSRETIIHRQWLSWEYFRAKDGRWILLAPDPPLPRYKKPLVAPKAVTTDYRCERTFEATDKSPVWIEENSGN
jgi:hypothetical protein